MTLLGRLSIDPLLVVAVTMAARCEVTIIAIVRLHEAGGGVKEIVRRTRLSGITVHMYVWQPALPQ